MAKKALQQKAPVSQETIQQCLAWSIAQGDMVNFRFLFYPNSPLREDSSEDITSEKYSYLHPQNTQEAAYQEALKQVGQPAMTNHVQQQLATKGPAQYPWQLVLTLADNAVRLAKYAVAAQAYELLRIRRRVQEIFLEEAEALFDKKDIDGAVSGYTIAAALEYDYAAFPEPLPATPKYQSRALLLHAEYPKNPEQCVALQPVEQHIQTMLSYLLGQPQMAERLAKRSLEERLEFVEKWIRRSDPQWDTFADRYRQACAKAEAFADRLAHQDEKRSQLETEVEEQQQSEEPRDISITLLGREIPEGEWWQYLKELAYQHPAATLFVGRQAVSRDLEIIMPRYRADHPLISRLCLKTQ